MMPAGFSVKVRAPLADAISIRSIRSPNGTRRVSPRQDRPLPYKTPSMVFGIWAVWLPTAPDVTKAASSVPAVLFMSRTLLCAGCTIAEVLFPPCGGALRGIRELNDDRPAPTSNLHREGRYRWRIGKGASVGAAEVDRQGLALCAAAVCSGSFTLSTTCLNRVENVPSPSACCDDDEKIIRIVISNTFYL